MDTEHSSLGVLCKQTAGEGDRKHSPQSFNSKVEVALLTVCFRGLHDVGMLHDSCAGAGFSAHNLGSIFGTHFDCCTLSVCFVPTYFLKQFEVLHTK